MFAVSAAIGMRCTAVFFERESKQHWSRSLAAALNIPVSASLLSTSTAKSRDPAARTFSWPCGRYKAQDENSGSSSSSTNG
jgi:hypothetical protein